MATIQNVTNTQQTILCCQCATPIPPNPANMCVDCIRNEVDITEGIPKQAVLHWCRDCERYQQLPSGWVRAELESRELLSICLKKLRGLQKVRLVDAGFIWTEPHSRRIKVKLTIQKEVFASTILQQVFVVEYTISNLQCEDCVRVAAKNTWRACVQVRQKVNHKRTFYFLEQLILKHNAHKDTVNIKEVKDGLDFYYAQRAHAIRMVEFLNAVVPIRTKTSEKIISSDIHTSTANFKHTYSVEILPICKDDLICLNPKMVRNMGMIGPIVLCTRISNAIHLIDPNTLKTGELRNQTYWEAPVYPICEATDLIEFYVIDIQLEGERNGKYALATAEVCKTNDFSTTYVVRTHLGNILNAGDHCMGYDLATSNLNNDALQDLQDAGKFEMPDVVLVKKSYPNRRKKQKSRNWKVKTLETVDDEDESARDKREREKKEKDFEMFLRDLEEDDELRGMVNLYKSSKPIVVPQDTDAMEESGDDEADFPEIQLHELLDDMKLEDEPME